jgi:hypothetical protein
MTTKVQSHQANDGVFKFIARHNNLFGNLEKIRSDSMDTKKILISLSLSFVILAFVSSSWAGETRIPLEAAKPHPNASGTAYLSGSSLSIHAKGLQPGSVYTVWFVNMKPKKHETGAGTAPYMFKSDSRGYGAYAATLSESPFGEWQMIMIVLHPNGNPKDMKTIKGALKARIPQTG